MYMVSSLELSVRRLGEIYKSVFGVEGSEDTLAQLVWVPVACVWNWTSTELTMYCWHWIN